MKTYIAIIISCMLLLQLSCKKDDSDDQVAPTPTPNPTQTDDPPLPDAVVAALDALPTVPASLDDIFFTDGESVRSFMEQANPDLLDSFPSGRVSTIMHSPRYLKKFIIGSMITVGENLLDRPKQMAAMNAPQQINGLAYGWGSKVYNQRKVPPGTGSGCTDAIYALDCSGLVYTMAFKGGLFNLSTLSAYNVANLSNANNWNDKGFKLAPDFSSLFMINMGYLPLSELETGDIIYWDAKDHIGMYIGNNRVIQSNGSRTASCSANMAANRGPRHISMSGMISTPDWGIGYKVLRIADNATAVFDGGPDVWGSIKYFAITDDGSSWPAAIAGFSFLSPIGYWGGGFEPTDTLGNSRIALQMYLPSTDVGTYSFSNQCYVITALIGSNQYTSMQFKPPPNSCQIQPGTIIINKKIVGGDGKTYVFGSYAGTITLLDVITCAPSVCYSELNVSGYFTALVF